MNIEIKTVSELEKSSQVVTCYDNLEFAERIDESWLNYHDSFIFVTTVMTSVEINISSDELSQSLLAFDHSLRIEKISKKRILKVNLQREIQFIS